MRKTNKCCGLSVAVIKKNQKNIIGVLILFLLIGYAVYAQNPDKFSLGKIFSKNLSEEEAKIKVAEFIENNLVQPGTKIEIKELVEESGLYKVTVGVAGQEVISYMTKQGTKFFPQAMDIIKEEAAPEGEGAEAEVAKEIPKSDKPEVKLFVMSYCPFGTQMVKGILPVVGTLGSKIKYEMGFVDYIMHGDKEIDENLLQYCIQKTQPAKLSNYMTCFLKKGEGTSDACLKTAGVNVSQVASCKAQADSQFGIKKKAADKSTWSNGQFPPFDVNKEENGKYGVQGSPTLVVNGVVASSGRDPASILKAICSAFNNPPKECDAKLSSDSPAPGFGDGTAPATAADASCH